MNDILQRDHRSIRGTIAYTSNKPERKGQERGREYFMINVHGDGRRSVIAHCEIDDRPSVMRDITYSLDGDWMPTDCFVRLTVDDRFMGSGWFRFADRFAECDGMLVGGFVGLRPRRSKYGHLAIVPIRREYLECVT